MDNKEPYRATKLWNEVIMAFQSGLPLKKHRRNIHTYSDCFMASDAVTWLHCYLMNNPNFGHDVTRKQTVNLLGKFLKCRVIENLSSKSKKCEFSDNSHLYRFTQVSPQKFKVFPLRLVQSPSFHKIRAEADKNEIRKPVTKKNKCAVDFQKENIHECVFVERKITLSEIGSIWKTSTLTRLQSYLQSIALENILDENAISGHVVKHNVSRISRTGVVSLIDKTDDIPHWVISAMKCLANWPNASGSGSCLPNYPGFEKDVFKVVRDFFINPQVPLVPNFLSSAMLTVFCHLLQDQIKPVYDLKSSFKNQESGLSAKHFSSSPSLTNVKTSTPVTNNETERNSSRNTLQPDVSDGKLLLDDPEVMWDYPSAVYYETDFATSDPVTKMVSSQSESRMLSYDSIHRSMESISTISVCSMTTDANSLINQIQKTPLKNWNSDSCLQNDNNFASNSLQLQTNTAVKHAIRQSHSMFDYLYIPYVDNEDQLNESTCSSKTITAEGDKLSLQNYSGDKQICVSLNDNQNNSSRKLSEKKSSPSECSGASENSYMENSLKKFEDIIFPSELKSSFQLMMLFLHPPNRRQLHLLFRVINKILKNKKFILDVKMPMREYLLQTFLPAIVQSDENQNILFGMVSFMLDNCEALFQPPSSLKEEVDEICKFRNGKIVYSVDDACYLTYCELVSKQQYEEQKVSISADALKSLLGNIIQDKKLSEKEKKKRIKQFKENHPEVYYEVFPGKTNLVRSKSTFLNRLANLRM